MYGSVPEGQVPGSRPGDVEGAENHGLLSGMRRPDDIVYKVIGGVVLVTAVISALIFFFFTPGTPPPPPPKPTKTEPKCETGKLDIFGECKDRGEFLSMCTPCPSFA